MSKKEKSIISVLLNNVFWIILILFIFIILPLYKCKEIPISKGSNDLIDMGSIYKESDKNKTTTSFWAKRIYSNGYDYNEINMDCSNHSYAVKTWLEYKDGKLIKSQKDNLYKYNRNSIIPNTTIEKYYKIVCQPYTRYIYKLESVYPGLKWKFSFLEN